MVNKLLALAVTSMTLSAIGCSTTPAISPNVTAILGQMNEQQAVQELGRLLPPRNLHGNPTRTFISGHIGLGLCKANHFSLDNQSVVDLQVTTEAITLNAVSMTTPAIGGVPGGFSAASDATSSRLASAPYRQHLRFDNIVSVTVTEPRLLRTVCGRQNGQSELLVREKNSHWYAALIPTQDKDRLVAAFMRLSPNATMTTEIEQ